jgi:chromosome segregation ATPase
MIKCDYCGNESMGLAYYYSRLGTYCTSQCAEKAKKESDPSVTDLLANLARRVSSLEQQLRDTQRNLEKFAEQTESNSEDIRELDDSTQPKPVFDTTRIKSFKLSDLNGKIVRIHSATDSAEGITVTTTVASDYLSGEIYVLGSEVVSR